MSNSASANHDKPSPKPTRRHPVAEIEQTRRDLDRVRAESKAIADLAQILDQAANGDETTLRRLEE